MSVARASRRVRQDYYPKLVLAVPFNPVTGRLLTLPDAARKLSDDRLRKRSSYGPPNAVSKRRTWIGTSCSRASGLPSELIRPTREPGAGCAA